MLTPTLRFRDSALEAEYAASFAREQRRMIRIAMGIALAIWFGCIPFDDLSAGSASNGAWATRVRLLVTPLLIPTAIFAWVATPAMFMRRWQPVASLAAGGVLGTALAWLGGMPDRTVFDPLDGTWGAVLAVFAAFLLVGLRFVNAMIIVGAFVVGAAAIVVWRDAGEHGVVMLVALMGAWGLGGLGAYHLERSRREVFLLRRKADHLLRNVLPGPIAERLQEREQRIAEQFDDVTVLFGDLVGFTALAEQLAPAELVEKLDEIFSELDDIAARHGLEKIKTIGDAYMVVGGVPTPRADHAHAVAAMALEMLAAVARRGLQMRIGIHSGPVVAGVIGKQKFSYDLWGDTVNTASRMESHGVEGRVHCSAATGALLEGAFVLEPRGVIAIKGKGEMETCFVMALTTS